MMSKIYENILNDDEFFGDIVDTPKEGIEQHKKWEGLKSVIDKGKRYLLGSKWTHERVDKASDETINKKSAEYKQRELLLLLLLLLLLFITSNLFNVVK